MDKTILLGSGEYGKVYKMRVNDQDVAVKFIENDEDGMRELGEVNLLKKFDHPNILKRFDELFVLPKEIGVCLPLASTDLAKAIQEGVSETKKERWVYQLLSAIHCIHKNGYYHCDIKPENVLIISGRAVVADLGIMGLQLVRTEACQTFANPQILYKRSDESEKILMTNPVYQKPFTNAQSDFWSLGETIYYIANEDYPMGNDVFLMNNYIETDNLPIDGEFNTIIRALLNPDPSNLNFNLTILLREKPFNGKYSDYVQGTVNNDVKIKNAIVFTRTVKKEFKILFDWIGNIFTVRKTRDIVAYNTIDMFYRIFSIAKNDHRLFISACLTLSGKTYNKFVNPKSLIKIAGNIFTLDQLLETESLIVEFLGGVLDRDLPIFYGVSFEKFKVWILDNPEKYEQFNMAGLVREINAHT